MAPRWLLCHNLKMCSKLLQHTFLFKSFKHSDTTLLHNYHSLSLSAVLLRFCYLFSIHRFHHKTFGTRHGVRGHGPAGRGRSVTLPHHSGSDLCPGSRWSDIIGVDTRERPTRWLDVAVEVTDLQWFVEVCICQQQSKLLHRKVQAKKVKYKKHLNMFLT